MPEFKNLHAAALAFIAVQTVAACSDSIAPSDTTPTFDDPLRASVEAMGFRKDMIEDAGDYFIVEGDIMIAKKNLKPLQPRLQKGGLRFDPHTANQYHTNNLVSPANVASIVIDTGGLDSDWQTALVDAIAEWNAISTGSTISISTGTAGADIIATTIAIGSSCSTVARADFPSNNNVGSYIQANSHCNSLGASALKKTMAHEIGHTLGFRHTNYATIGQGGGPEESCPQSLPNACGINVIPGTGTDANSVMNGAQGGTSWNGFSADDKKSALYLYGGVPSVSISYSGGTTPVLSWSSVSGAVSYRVRLHDHHHWWSSTFNMEWDAFAEIGTTSSLTYTDSSNWYTGSNSCYYNNTSAEEEGIISATGYGVEAVFAHGVGKAGGVTALVARSQGGWPADYCY